MSSRIFASLLALLLLAAPAFAAKKALFDNTHAQTAGNADWIIDTDQPLPVPDQSTVTQATPETYWTGANSSWGIAMVKRGYQVATLTSSFGITYQNPANPYDLSNYDVFIVNEPNTKFTSAESTAVWNYVRDGGGLFVISDHNASDRNNDGFDSPHIWNLMDAQQLWGVHFGVAGDANNSISQTSTNKNTSPTDPIINGSAGIATGIAFHAGTTMTLNTAANASVTGDVWMNTATNGGTTGAMVAHSTYGTGRIVFVSDSSPADDGTGSSGTVFNGWAEVADSLIFLNGTLWATRTGGAADVTPPSVTLTSPVGGESWGVASVHNATWTATDNVGVTTVDLAYSTDGGATYPNAIATGLTNTGTYAWTIPALLSNTVRVRVTARDAAANSAASSSGANLAFTGWAITATQSANGAITPAGTAVVADGATPTYTITADPNFHVADVKVNNVSVGVLTSYPFPPVHSNQTITATFAANSSDTQAPIATITSPTGGENWNVGSLHAITWTATDNTGVTSIDLAYSVDAGASFSAIASGLANSSTYNWTVPAVLSSQARVRVTAHDGAGNLGADSSAANFTIGGWTITASASANGAIAPSGGVVVGDGATPAFTITPTAGFQVADVLVNGLSVGAVTNYTFLPVHSNQTIAASFSPSSFTVNVTVAGSGSVAKSPDQPSYLGGSSLQLTATPTPGWNFAGWSGSVTGSANPLNLTVTSNLNITATFSQHVYTWNQAGSAAWTTAANWTPARTTPATDDVLVFNGGGAVTATAVPTQSIGQLQVASGTNVTLTPSGAAALTLNGSSGNGLDIGAGSTLTVTGATAMGFQLTAGVIGTIKGTVNFSGGAHRLQATSASSLLFQSGSVMTLATGFTGNAFGTTALSSVIFQGGSLYVQGSGANPFGATQPNSVVIWQPGSRFRMDGNLTPSLAGRNYADVEFNNAALVAAPAGTAAWSMDSLIVTQGSINFSNIAGGGTLRGSMVVQSGGTVVFTPATTIALTFGGTTPNRVHLAGTFTHNATLAISLNNPAGLTLTSPVTLGAPFTFVHGLVRTGGNVFAIGAAGNLVGAAQNSGWVYGNLRRNVSAGNSSRLFDIGDATAWTPVVVAMTGAASALDVTASTTLGDHPQIGSSDLDVNRSVNRYWNLTPVGTPSFTSYDVTLNYTAGDVDAGAQTNNFLVRRYSAGWTSTNFGSRTATSTQATGVTGWGDFAVAQVLRYTLAVNVLGSGSVQKTPDQPDYAPGTVVQLLATANSGFAFTGYSGAVNTAANPTPVTMNSNQSVTATFTGITYTIDASADVNGTITPSGPVIVNAGANQSFGSTPNSGFQILDVLVDGVSVGPVTLYGFTNVTANHTIAVSFVAVNTGVLDGPLTLALARPMPNPSIHTTLLAFSLPHAAFARIEILDAGGRRVAVHEGDFAAGRYQWRWDGTDASGARVGSGLYFARMTTPLGTRQQRIALLR